jgi:hypothetical protein
LRLNCQLTPVSVLCLSQGVGVSEWKLSAAVPARLSGLAYFKISLVLQCCAVKVKVTLEEAMKTQRGSGDIALLFL